MWVSHSSDVKGFGLLRVDGFSGSDSAAGVSVLNGAGFTGGGRCRGWFVVLLVVLVVGSLLAVVPVREGASAQTPVPTANPDGSYTVPRDWPLKPSGLSAGSTFRLLFLTTTWRDATSHDISDYDTHVQSEIGRTAGNADQIAHPAIRPYASLFKVVGSTASVDARDHTNMNPDTDGRGEHIFWLNGPLVAVSNNTFWRDVWDNWLQVDRRDQSGARTGNDWPFTGTGNGGAKSPNPLGGTGMVTTGRFRTPSPGGDSDRGPLSHSTALSSSSHSFYGISPVFVVESFVALSPVFGRADPSKTTVEVLHSSIDGVVRYSFDGVDPYNRDNVYEDVRPGASFMVDEHESCAASAGSAVVDNNWHPDPSTYGDYRKLTYTVKLSQPPPTWRNAVMAIYGPDDKHPRDRTGFKGQYDKIFAEQLGIVGRTSPMWGMGNQLPEGRVTVPTSHLHFTAANWDIPQEVEVWVRCANPHNPWEDIHIFHGVYPVGTTSALGKPKEASWYEVTVTVIDANTSPRPADVNSAVAYPGRMHVHLDPYGGFNIAEKNWQVPIHLHWRTARIDAFQAGGVSDRQKVNDDAAARRNFRKFEVKVEGMAKGMSDPRSDGLPTYADGDRLPTTLTFDVSPEKLVGGKGDPFENYYPAYFFTPDLKKDSVVHSPGSPIYRMTVTPYSIRGFRVPGEAVQQCIHVRSSDEDPVTGVGATENKSFYLVACPSNFPNAPASQLLAEPPMLTVSSPVQWVDEGSDASFTVTADRTLLLDTSVNVYVSQEMGDGLNYVGAEEAATITLPAGSRTVDWTITAFDDDQQRVDGTIEARINPSDAYGVTNPRGVTIPLIDDDDVTRVVTVTAGPGIIEGDPAGFTVSVSPPPAAPLDVTVAVTGDGDFGAATGRRTVTVPTSGTATLTVGTRNDGGGEADGTVTVTAVAGPRYTLHATDYTAGVTVSDDDYRVDPAVLATVYQGTADDGMGNMNRRVWQRVLIAFGLGEDNWIRGGLRALTSTQARQQYGSDPVWQPVITELEAYEAAVRQQENAKPVVTVAAGPGVAEGADAGFTFTATPAPQATLYVNVWVEQTGVYGVTNGRRQVVIPTTGTATLVVATTDDSTGEPDGAVTVTLNKGNRYKMHATDRRAVVTVADNDGFTVDAQLVADVRSYMAETQHGPVHVNRWKRVLEAFGVEDYPNLEPMTSTEAKRKYGTWARWQPVIPVLEAIETASQTVVPQVVTPVVSITAGSAVTEGGNAGFTVTANPAPAADLPVTVSVTQTGDYGAVTGTRTVTVPTSGIVSFTVPTTDDSTDELDGSVTATVNGGAGYTVSGSQGAGTVNIADDDDPAPTGPVLDAQLEADVRSYAAETHHGALHVNRWKRVLEAFGLEDYPNLEPTTLDEAGVHVDIGRPRWIPVLAHMVALDAVNPQPAPTPATNVQVDGQVLATARSKAAETHRGQKHVNRWKRVLEAFGDADYPNLEPLTAAGAQVYANVWSGWTQVAAELARIEAAATTVLPPVVVAPTPEVNILSSGGGTEGQTVTFTITANPAPASDLDVGVGVVTSGDFGYGPTPTTVTIPTGGTATVSVTTTDDSTDEPDGSVTLTINGGAGYTIGAYGSDSVDVTDDDNPPPVVAPVVAPDPVVSVTAGSAVTEGGNAKFTITANPAPASGLPVTVTVTADGDYGAVTGSRTVTVPTSGIVSFTVPTSDDSTDETDGSVTATVNTGTGYTVSAGHGAGTVNVADNDDPPTPVVSVTAGSAVTEGGNAKFTITANPAPQADLPVTVTVTADGDYGAVTGSRTVTVPTSGIVSFTVATTDDSTDEPDGSVTATVNTGNGYTVSASHGAGTVAVSDNDDPPPPSTVTVSVGDASGSEADWGAVDFQVTLSEASTEEVRVWFSTSNWPGLTGRAHMWLDYQLTQRTVVFAPGQTERTVTVWLFDDNRPEPDEYFTVTLSNPQGATISRGTATGTILDND